MKKLFLLSFLILFLELSLIRWIPPHSILVSFFSNFILLASFLGIGVGMLLSRGKQNLFILFPFLLLILFSFVVLFPVEITINSSEAIFFKSPAVSFVRLKPEYILPIIFLLVSLTFIPLAEEFGRLFINFKPLRAYSIDILGSLSGILLFTLLSFLNYKPFVWFIFISLFFLVLYPKKKKIGLLISTAILIIIVIFSFLVERDSLWSSYYKINILKQDKAYFVRVNNSDHFIISSKDFAAPFYFAVYDRFKDRSFKNILIIGAGGGLDTAVALANNPEARIDAVEIDPVLLNLGKQLNPDKPYNDPKVHLFVADGRNFIQNSEKKYDLIIYTLTDSETLSYGYSDILLESFLYTKEAFLQVERHLTKNGVFSVYNLYRRDWLIEKLANMLKVVFNKPPLVLSFDPISKATAFITGPGVNISSNFHSFGSYSLAEDDWPFFYLRARKVPSFYINTLFAILVISVSMLILAIKSIKRIRLDFRFFFFGLSFLLLETKSLSTFSLLFGNTWLVNSLVFFAILFSVLLANILSEKLQFISLKPLYIGLFFTLFLNYFIQPEYFLLFPLIFRYIAASLFYFLPICLANVIFSQVFKNAEKSDISFASNVLGAVMGGVLAYFSLMLGYRSLLLFSIISYFFTFILSFFEKAL